jgi:hypothetical protein
VHGHDRHEKLIVATRALLAPLELGVGQSMDVRVMLTTSRVRLMPPHLAKVYPYLHQVLSTAGLHSQGTPCQGPRGRSIVSES